MKAALIRQLGAAAEPGEAPEPSGETYVEYYRNGRRFFREYYNLLRDPWQLRNLLRDSNPAGPNVAPLSAQLRHDRRCRGTSGARACP